MGRFFAIVACLVVFGCSSRGTEIYCPECKKHLYTYDGEIKTFPLDEDRVREAHGVGKYDKNKRFICPFDKAPINGYEYFFYEKDRNAPKFMYKALTVLTKKKGKLVWYPYDINKIEDY